MQICNHTIPVKQLQLYNVNHTMYCNCIILQQYNNIYKYIEHSNIRKTSNQYINTPQTIIPPTHEYVVVSCSTISKSYRYNNPLFHYIRPCVVFIAFMYSIFRNPQVSVHRQVSPHRFVHIYIHNIRYYKLIIDLIVVYILYIYENLNTKANTLFYLS